MTNPQPRRATCGGSRFSLTCFCLLAAFAFPSLVPAAETRKRHFELEADLAVNALRKFAAQSGTEVLFGTRTAEKVRTNAVRGEFTPYEAMKLLLAGTGLVTTQDRTTGALTISADPNAKDTTPNGRAPDSPEKKEAQPPQPHPPMKRNNLLTKVAAAIALLAGSPAGAQNAEHAGPAARGTVSGRVLNESTGQYLRSANVTIVGTRISTTTESGGVYTLPDVPAGPIRIAVAYAGLDPVEVAVTVTAGQNSTRNIAMRSAGDSDLVKMGAFRVVTERDGNFQAIQEQKSALEIKSVVASDAFGDVSEGNIGEFMKLMPGVMMDYVDADVRAVSIGGLDPKYAVIMMDGAPVASSGSSNINTGRTFEFEQLSISSIETVELSKTPTPDVAGSALAGVVNLRSRGAFDRKGRVVRWSASTQMNSHQLTLKRTPGPSDRLLSKFQPNGSLEFSDVYGDRLGVIAGVSFARTMVEQNITNYGYVFNASAADNATEVPRMSTFTLIDAPKTTNRGNYNLRLDYKVSSDLSFFGRIDYNTYSAWNFQRNARLRFANAVNGPAATDPRQAGVEYSLASQTSTSATSEIYGSGFHKHGATTTASAGGSYRRGAFRADAQGQMSRSRNYYDDLKAGFFQGGLTGQLPGLAFRWDRRNGGDAAFNATQLAGADWRDLASYRNVTPSMDSRYEFNSKDQKWTAKTDMRYNLRARELPILVKWGGDISQSIRNVDRMDVTPWIYLGPDGRAGTGDEGWAAEPHYRARNLAGGNISGIPGVDRFARAREVGTNPERFTPPSAAELLRLRLRGHWDVKEQIDSAYSQIIFKVTPRFDFAPGVRVEQTRSTGRGPLDRGDTYARRVLGGSPTASIPTNTVDYYNARYSGDAENSSAYHTWLKYLHATYRLTNDLIVRASFNDSITRPDLSNLAGGITLTPDSSPPTATIPNAALQAESGRNLFASVEYYFPKRAGFFSVSAARRDISNLIRSSVHILDPTEDFPNSEGLDLRGYRVTTTDNVGKAHLGSMEFSYRQNMVFLPGLWQRLSVFANYTILRFDNYENFRRPENLTSGGVSFDHRGFSFRWNVVWVPIHRRGAIPANGWVNMTGERLSHDMQMSCRISPRLTLFANARNIFNQVQRVYYGPGRSDFIQGNNDYGAIWTAGLRGQF
ncbi:MAG: TonB-dependent receptor [Verrucomicrobia bacterium]|nr:TonB-dependent receptor [Verrucomicrobiota bacterium]